MVIADEKISSEEVNLLASKWNLTNYQVLQYIASVTGNVELGKGWDAAGYAAGESWKLALKELNAYLAAVGKGAFVAPQNVPTTNPTNPFSANIEQLEAATKTILTLQEKVARTNKIPDTPITSSGLPKAGPLAKSIVTPRTGVPGITNP